MVSFVISRKICQISFGISFDEKKTYQNKRLHKPPHRFVIVGKLAKDLDDHSWCEGSMGIHLTNFSFAIAKIELLDFLVDFLLAMHLKNQVKFYEMLN